MRERNGRAKDPRGSKDEMGKIVLHSAERGVDVGAAHGRETERKWIRLTCRT